MGLLSSGIKAARTATRSVPKREMNPLVKRKEKELTKKINEENSTSKGAQTIGKMYSPIVSTAEQMDIGLKGTKGENIEGFLRKRAPNVTEAEKQFYELNLEPQQKYTRDEILDNLKGTNKEYTIRKESRAEVGDELNWQREQRQPIIAKVETYEELTVDADKGSIPLGEEVTHFSPETVVHTRLSVIRPFDEPDYKAVLVEEIQSDVYKIAGLTDEQMSTIYDKRHTPFSGEIEEINRTQSALKWHKQDIDLYGEEYGLFVDNEKGLAAVLNAFDKLEKLESNTRVQSVLENGRRNIREETRLRLKDAGIIVNAKDNNDLIEKAFRYILKLDETNIDPDEMEMMGGLTDLFDTGADEVIPSIMKRFNRQLKDNIDINKGYEGYTSGIDPRKAMPVKTKTDVVRKGILANIAYAKENGINKILIPSYKEIAAQRVSTFSSIAHTIKDQKTAEKYIKLYSANYEDAANEVAQKYFEKVFKPIYEDALSKVLRTLMKETKGQIKVGKKTMPYRGVLQNKQEVKTLTEIDITDFEYDPKTDTFRFKEGGVVGTKTNKKTQAGRDVYETPEGEMVSEKSTTFKYKGQWINIPSIHEGHRYDDDTLILMLEAGLIEPTSVHKNKEEAEQAARKRSDSLKFNQGGTPMLEQQMELFEDGGLRDEGGEVDEVSGNEVPIGGTKEGVRDDVPALVSKGEFVFPEDVTRYIGLDKLMQMRQEAKMGLKRMDAMGQMGNGDEATMPDDMPFGMADLIVVAGDTGEELEMAEGGFVTRPTTATRTQPQQQPTYTQPPVERPPEFRSTRALTPAIEQPQRSAISFKDLMDEAFLEFKEYRNEQGQSLFVAFIGDKPVYNIPAGYTLYDPEAVGEEPNETVEEVNEALKQTPPEPDKVDSGFTPDLRSEFQRAGSWDGASLDMYIKEASKFTNGSTSAATGLMGAIGGPILGGAMYLGTKMQKKKILETIDARIEEARGTPIAGQVAALQEIKKQLEEGGGGLLDSVVNVVTNIFAPEEVKTKATNAANVDASESATVTTDAVVAAVSPQIVSTRPSYATMDVGEAGRGTSTTPPPVSDPSGPAAAEATFGAPLSDKTPPPVDELVFTPTIPQQTQTFAPVKGDRAGVITGPPISTTDQPAFLSDVPVAGDRARVLWQTTPYDGVSPNTKGTAGNRAGVLTPSNIQPRDPYAGLDKYPLPPPAPISGPKQSELAGGVATVPQQTYTSTGAQMQASQKALQDVAPILPDSAPMLEPYEPAPITTGIGYDTSLGQDTSSYAVTPEQVAYSTSVSKGQEDPYDPRGILPVSEQVTRAQPVTVQAQVEAPSMAMPDAFVKPLPVPSRRTSEAAIIPPMTVKPPLIGSTQLDTDFLTPTVDTTGGAQIRTDRGFVPTNVADPAATAETVKPVSEVATDRGYVPTNVADPAITVDTSGDYADPRGREQLPSVEQKLSSLRPDETSLRPKARPTVTEKRAAKVPAVKKVEKPKGKYNPADSPLAAGFKGNKLSIKEQKVFDNSIDRGDDALTNHYAAINRLRNKQDAFAEGGFNRAEGAAMGLSSYDMEQAEKFGGSMQTAIDKGTHVRQKNPFKEPRKVTKDKPAGSQKSDEKEDSGCVIATHGISTGGFSLMDKAKAEIWCERTYHGKWYGEAFRRGYRYAGTRAIEKGKAREHYQEFKDFVAYGRGLKKDWKSSINYYKRTIQFFLTGLFVKEDI
jgi:hypothetical protein